MSPWPFDFSLARFPNHLLAVELMRIEPILPVVFQDLVLDACKEGRQAVVILLSPLIKGMIVAFSALQADAEKHLAKGLGPALRVAQSSIEVGCRLAVAASLGRDQLAGKLIKGLTVCNAIA